MLAIMIETKYMYSVEHNHVFIALVATTFGRYDRHQANVAQNFNVWLHVVHQNVQLCGITCTPVSVFVNRLTFLILYDMIYKWSLCTEEKRGTKFRSSTDEIFETLTWNNKTT